MKLESPKVWIVSTCPDNSGYFEAQLCYSSEEAAEAMAREIRSTSRYMEVVVQSVVVGDEP